MQFVEIQKPGKQPKRITEYAWAREQNKRYKDWQLTGTVTNNPSPKAQRFPAPEHIQRKPFLPPELQTLRPKIEAPAPVVTTTADTLPPAPVEAEVPAPVQEAPAPVVEAPAAESKPPVIRRGAAKAGGQ